MTKQELERMKTLFEETKQLEQKKEDLLEQITGLRQTISDMPRSATHMNKMDEYLIRLEELESRFAEQIEERNRLYLRFMTESAKLKPRESRVLNLRCVEDLGWRRIARRMHYSESRIRHIYKEAEDKIAEYYDLAKEADT